MPSKRLPSEMRIARSVEEILAQRLPPDWSLRTKSDMPARRYGVDLLVEVISPSDEPAVLVIEIKRRVDPRLIPEAAEQVASRVSDDWPTARPVVAAAYLAPRSREILEDLGVGYVDTTGNVRIEMSTPGLFISTAGADRDPWPQDSDLQSLRGRGAGRAVRAIIDTAPPFGIRELASSTGASAATVSRVVDLLDREGIVTRQPRGPVLAVDWQAAIRRWAEDYDQLGSNTVTTLLEPRGLTAVEKKLAAARFAYAATGAFAAQRFDPIAPARTATVYVDDATDAASRLGLRETETGANIVLLEPFDPVVFDRITKRDGLRCVGPSQLAVDLLTGPGREPSQGEEILGWMTENKDAWRS